MAQQLNHLVSSVAALTSVAASAEALLTDISNRLREASNNDDMDAVDNLADEIDARTEELSNAVQANTPADPASETTNSQPDSPPEPTSVEAAPDDSAELPSTDEA